MIFCNLRGLPAFFLERSRVPRTRESGHAETFLPAAKSHRVPRLVKALDHFAAHVRAALTSLGTRMQNTSAMKECLRVFDLRTVLHVPFALFYPSNRLSKPVRGPRQLPDRPPSDSTPAPLPAAYVQLLRESLEVVQRKAAVIPRAISRRGGRPAKQPRLLPDGLEIN